eukprot:CAMPEP_0113603720 /NCGR_PEP_ID=MMETSP0017_2-20120614/1424_1 /TAXON_ID=2856 /ORGANISM="Cylindrotheca closterium" /LENGTH=95 /DNA_ID=CAMNT_0000512121 /DNA_START=1362 /DNA_END=1649 /DNA_ORIENTATION=- /assembly_acc=CAM_ASM_000147
MAYLRRLVFKRNNHIHKRGSLLTLEVNGGMCFYLRLYSHMTAHRDNHAGFGGFDNHAGLGGVFDNILLQPLPSTKEEEYDNHANFIWSDPNPTRD